MSEIKDIRVVPYNPNWPKQFEAEAAAIKQALDSNCLAVQHVGSTSVPHLKAKPKIDIIAVVKDPAQTVTPLENIDIQYRGEYNIPLHYGFSKRGAVDVNLHVYPEGHPEIELNLTFRDFLRSHPKEREEYAALKEEILKDASSFFRSASRLPNYTIRKSSFIKSLLKKAGFKQPRMLKCSDAEEWSKAKQFRKEQFPEKDPYSSTFNHPKHEHLSLYLGTEIIGYAHLEILSNDQASLHFLTLSPETQLMGLDQHFLNLIKKWLGTKGRKIKE